MIYGLFQGTVPIVDRRTEENHESLLHSWFPSRYSNHVPPEYKLPLG